MAEPAANQKMSSCDHLSLIRRSSRHFLANWSHEYSVPHFTHNHSQIWSAIAHHGVDAADHLSIVVVRFESRHWRKDHGSEPEALDSTQRAEQGEILNSMTLTL